MSAESVIDAVPAPAVAAPSLPSIDQFVEQLKGGTASDPNISEQRTSPISVDPSAITSPEPKSEAKEAPASEKKDPPVKDPQASRFAALTRKEKEIRAQLAASENRAKEVEARIKAANERDEVLSNARKSPLDALKALGLSMTDVVNAAYGKYEAAPEDPLDTKLKPVTERATKVETETAQLKAQLEELRNQLSAKEQQTQYDQVMGDIRKTVEGDKAQFEVINAMGDEGIDLVRDTMVEYWAKNQKMLDYSAACGMVEKYYEDEVLTRLAGTTKLKGRITPAASATNLASKQAPKMSKESPTTLTNKLATASPANVDIDKLPKEEALAYLANKMRYKG